MNQAQRIAVVGIGPVGGILAAHLLEAGSDVTVVDPFVEHMEKIRAEGLVIEGFRQLKVPIRRSFPTLIEAAAEGMQFDVVFVCVKSPMNARVAEQIPAVLAEGGVGVSFQNGLETSQGIAAQIGAERTLRGVVNYAGNLVEPGRIRMTFFNGANYVGSTVSDHEQAAVSARQLAAVMTAAKMDTDYSPNVGHHVWEKVLRNAALMPVSALTGMNMAEVMDTSCSLDLVERLLQEGMAVAALEGFEFDQKFYDETLAYYRKAGPHMPSMWGDVVAKRKTEIGVLNGKIAEYGERDGVPVPYNRAITNLVLCVDELTVLRKRA